MAYDGQYFDPGKTIDIDKDPPFPPVRPGRRERDDPPRRVSPWYRLAALGGFTAANAGVFLGPFTNPKLGVAMAASGGAAWAMIEACRRFKIDGWNPREVTAWNRPAAFGVIGGLFFAAVAGAEYSVSHHIRQEKTAFASAMENNPPRTIKAACFTVQADRPALCFKDDVAGYLGPNP